MILFVYETIFSIILKKMHLLLLCLHKKLYDHLKILIYDFSITKEFICNINCRIFSTIQSTPC